MEIGQRLKELRTKKQLRQADVSKYLGISVSTYTKYETGTNQPDLTMLSKLSDFYDVSVDYLLGLSSNKKPLEIISPQEQEYVKLLRQLTTDDRSKILEISKTFIDIYNKQE